MSDEQTPIDPINLYDVAMTSDRVLRIKRALESSGFSVKVETTVSVNISLSITDPPKKKRGKE
jgi:hypothetical protein